MLQPAKLLIYLTIFYVFSALHKLKYCFACFNSSNFPYFSFKLLDLQKIFERLIFNPGFDFKQINITNCSLTFKEIFIKQN